MTRKELYEIYTTKILNSSKSEFASLLGFNSTTALLKSLRTHPKREIPAEHVNIVCDVLTSQGYHRDVQLIRNTDKPSVSENKTELVNYILQLTNTMNPEELESLLKILEHTTDLVKSKLSIIEELQTNHKE